MDTDNTENTYVDNIDTFFDNMIDKLYIHISKEHSKLSNSGIDKLISSFNISYAKNNLKTSNKEIIKLYSEIADKYTYFYTLIYVSTRVNDFTQFILSFKKDSIFNSTIIQTKVLMDKIFYLYKNDKNIRSGSIILDDTYFLAVEYYNSLSQIFIDDNKVSDVRHSLIKYILYTAYFVPKHKPDLFVKLEILELEQSESKMIEVVRSIDTQVDYTAIERLISSDLPTNVIDDIYSMMSGQLTDNDEFSYDRLTGQGKMEIAFKRLLLTPIIDDFLRLNKNTETYDTTTNISAKDRVNKKNNTKIRYILGKMNDVLDFNKNQNEAVFHPPELHRKAVIINHMEELDIIRKLETVHNKTDDQIAQLDDLGTLRKYPYQNFRDSKQNSFSLKTSSTISALRYSNVEHKTKIPPSSMVEWRILNNEMSGDVVGIAITSNNNLNINMHNFLEAKFKNHTTVSSMLGRSKKTIIMNDSNPNKIYHWIFDKKTDFDKRFVDIDTMTSDEYYNSIIVYIIDQISNMSFDRLINILGTMNNHNIYEMFKMATNECLKIMPLSETKRHELTKHIYSKAHQSNVSEFNEKIFGLDEKLVPLSDSTIVFKEKININHLVITDEGTMYNNSQCQHIVTWRKIKQMRMKNPNKYNDTLQEFIKEFIIENDEKEFICRSCSNLVELKNHVTDWKSTTEEGITLTLSLKTSLEKISEYEKYNVAIKNINKYIEKFAGAAGLSHLSGSGLGNDLKRQAIIKNIIDLINIQYEKLLELNSEKTRRARFENAFKTYGILPKYTEFLLFELKNEIFTFTSNEIDKLKKNKLNNIIAFINVFLIIEMSNNNIENIPMNKLLNYYVFEKIGISMFDGLRIRINNGNDISEISNYKLLCYVIFILSGLTVKYKMWIGDNGDKTSMANAQSQKMVIHTIVDIINDVLNTSKTNNKFIYDFYSKRFFIGLREKYSGQKAEETIKIIRENINNKVVLTSGSKLIFKTAPEKEFILQEYTELSDFGQISYSQQIGNIYTSFRYTIPVDEILSHKDLQRIYAKRKIRPLKLKPEKIQKINKFIPVKVDKGDFYNKVNESIKKWEDIIGKDTKINGDNLYLHHVVYHVDHDYRGNKLDEPYKILNKDKCISFKKMDPHFLIDVYLFHNKKNDVYMYYNSNSYEYMGYRSGDSYIDIYNMNCNLQPTSSIMHMLLFMGHTNMSYPIDAELKTVINNDITMDNYILHRFVSNIIKTRIHNVKNILFAIQRIMNQMIHDKKRKTEKIALKFAKKFNNIVTSNSDKRIFDDVNEVVRGNFYKKIPINTEIIFNKEYLYSADIMKINNADQNLIIYMCSEFNKLIDMNDNMHSKINIVYLISNIIKEQYENYNYREISMMKSDVRKFVKMESNLYSKTETPMNDIFTDMNEEEINELKEEMYDDQEAIDSMDVDFDSEDEDSGEQLADTFRE